MMSINPGMTEELRTDLVEQVAREIRLRGITGPAVCFLEASRADQVIGNGGMLLFDPVLRSIFGGEHGPASAILTDELGIEQLLERLEDLDEDLFWDA